MEGRLTPRHPSSPGPPLRGSLASLAPGCGRCRGIGAWGAKDVWTGLSVGGLRQVVGGFAKLERSAM
jgi:hypothetical protein